MADQPRLAIESIAGQRPYQEDAVLAEKLDDGRVLVAVADGMGGHAAGEVASAIALETLLEAVRDRQSLGNAFALANERVHVRANEPGKHGMGTTLVALLIDNGEVRVANVGDSRGYLITREGIRQLTEDHSFVAEAVKRGQSEAEAMAGPYKDALTRSIGTEEEVEVDVFGPMAITDDSAFLVCSDGLYKTLANSDLLRIYSQSRGPQGAARSLVSTALQAGSDDNISVAIAEYGNVRRVMFGTTMPLEYPGEDEAGPDATASKPAESETSSPAPAEGLHVAGSASGAGVQVDPPLALADPGRHAPEASKRRVRVIAAAVLAVGALLALLLLR